jgi:hypothetical protein
VLLWLRINKYMFQFSKYKFVSLENISCNQPHLNMLQSYRLLLAELFMIIFLIEKLFNLWVSTFLVRFPLCTVVSFVNKTDRPEYNWNISEVKKNILNLICTTLFWNNIHEVCSKSKDWIAKYNSTKHPFIPQPFFSLGLFNSN